MRRVRIIKAHRIVDDGDRSWVAHGDGRRRAISRSNRRNRMATRKKRIEYGSRAEPRGSNPHSYGDSFSVSGLKVGSQKLTAAKIIDKVSAISIYGSIIFSRG